MDHKERQGRWRLAAMVGLVAAGILAGCMRAPEPVPVAPSYRGAEAPIGSAALFERARFVGPWHQVAQYPGGCAGAQIHVEAAESGLAVTQICGSKVEESLWLDRGEGRFETPAGPLWILWVDSGYRTAVLGRPDGEIGAIWNRDRSIPADRMNAAREILDFSGYDLGQLVENRR